MALFADVVAVCDRAMFDLYIRKIFTSFKHIGLLFTDLSKAFDCLPYSLFVIG